MGVDKEDAEAEVSDDEDDGAADGIDDYKFRW